MSVTITKTWRVNGSLTDVTSMLLEDVTGTYGVKRNDTDAVVTASGTAMTWASTGTYTYTFAEPAYSLVYSTSVKVTYLGSTYFLTDEDVAGNDPTPTATGLSITYPVICQEVAHYRGWGRGPTWSADRTATLDAIVRSGLTQFYFHAAQNGLTHQWSFMSPLGTFSTTVPYSTGTIAVVDGVVTLGGGGTWPSWAAQGELVVDSDTYTISTRDSNTQVTLTNDWVDVTAGATYSLGRTRYDLPVDFMGSIVNDKINFRPGVNYGYPPIHVTSDTNVRDEQQKTPWSDVPRIASLRPKAFVATTGQRWELVLYPTPDAAYECFYRYKVAPGMLDGTNVYPLGGIQHGETILASCLAVAEQRLMDGGDGRYAAAYMERLAASIAEDQAAFTPKTLGCDGGNEQSDTLDGRSPFFVIQFDGINW